MDAYLDELKMPPKNPNRILTTSDICLKKRVFANKPDFSLDIRDIEGARAKKSRRDGYGTCRETDPLNPKYRLASVPPPRRANPDPISSNLVRNSMDISDIEGAQPKKRREMRMKMKREIEIEIDSKQKTKRKKRDSLQVGDINRDKSGTSHWRGGNRITNPLDPIYRFDRHRITGVSKKSIHNKTKGGLILN